MSPPSPPVQPAYPLRTERLRLRPVSLDDLEAVHSYRSMPDVARYLPHAPHGREDTMTTLSKMVDQSGMTALGDWLDLAVEFDGSADVADSSVVVGEVLLKWDAENSNLGEIGFVFHPSVAGTGVATEATIAVLRLAFEQFGWHRVIGICDILNLRSSALMERVGMRREAVFLEAEWFKGRWATMCHYAMLQREWQARCGDAAPPSVSVQPSV